MPDILQVILLSIGSICALFVLTKLMGYRQMSELSMFDYINGITIGSIAAEMATSLEDNFIMPLTAMIVYAIFTTLLSIICNKSMAARRFIDGAPLVIMNKDIIYEKNLKKSKLDINELLQQCRVNGYFDISKLQTIILESNGKLSFLPKTSDRPLTPNDMNITPEQDFMVANVIIDGNVLEKNLTHSGKDRKWLDSQIKAHNVSGISQVLLATCDSNNQLHVYPKTKNKAVKDILE